MFKVIPQHLAQRFHRSFLRICHYEDFALNGHENPLGILTPLEGLGKTDDFMGFLIHGQRDALSKFINFCI